MNPLQKRARQVLCALVTEFIGTGEPVGSRTLTRKYGFTLSPATIRTVLADLEESGYLVQPHASAGRVPTPQAFRIFIDALMQERTLPENEAHRINEHFTELRPGADVLRETGKLLSDLSGAPAVLIRLRADQRALSKIHFIRTRPQELLAVLVATDGTVDNRFIQVDRPGDDAELDRLHRLLDEVVSGKTLRDVRDHFAREAENSHDEIARLNRLAHDLLGAAAQGLERRADVVIEGQARLLDQPEFGSVNSLRELMAAFEDRERLVKLLDQAIFADRVNVFLGEETRQMVGCAVSLVAAAYRDEDGAPTGAVGVIGPERMDYPFVVPLVGATAEAMTVMLQKKREPS
ncbi:MAG TPA: heat-inducible transcriptional repressor HrcA [Polyangiaceae bacterium]|nr:heat-inducible transcriptional repressor HrcA [Polyangiaceae bacterium]